MRSHLGIELGTSRTEGCVLANCANLLTFLVFTKGTLKIKGMASWTFCLGQKWVDITGRLFSSSLIFQLPFLRRYLDVQLSCIILMNRYANVLQLSLKWPVDIVAFYCLVIAIV